MFSDFNDPETSASISFPADYGSEYLIGTIQPSSMSCSNNNKNNDHDDVTCNGEADSFSVFQSRRFQVFKLVTVLESGKSFYLHYQLLDNEEYDADVEDIRISGPRAIPLHTYNIECPNN